MPIPELALSIQQPWAWLLLHGALRVLPDGRKVALKDCENRTWALPRQFWGKRTAIHAGKTLDLDVPAFIWPYLDVAGMSKSRFWQEAQEQRGGLVGELTWVRDVTRHASIWTVGPHIWLVTDPVAYDKVIPCKGKLGFFKPEAPDAH